MRQFAAMSRYDASQVEVLVLTFKEGALSALAHDLKIRVTHLELELEAAAVSATFDATSLRVVCARKDGNDSTAKIDPPQIEKNIVKDVLEAAKHPQIRFQSTQVTPTEVVGNLTLHGVTREIRCARKPDGRVEARLDQRDFGIKPYSAMFGALKVKPEVVVTVRPPS
jgi:hypothetical protein